MIDLRKLVKKKTPSLSLSFSLFKFKFFVILTREVSYYKHKSTEPLEGYDRTLFTFYSIPHILSYTR